ncbi:MAG: ATP-binding protein [Thermoplasmata archaeon]|nr:MAG: ATP-binding protein [Thermoplasmata archaeon]KAA0014894.1 MAG: ATP-binding protein [Thermoplasmata archaeon]
MVEEIFLNPNEPNPNFMVYKEEARKIILKALGSKSECFWILGKTGIGKTTFLLWINEFAPLYKVDSIYFHGGEELKFEEFKEKVEKKLQASFFSRIFLRKKYSERPILLLIDEVEHIKDENIFKYIVSKLDETELHLSVVFASVEMVEEVKKYLKGRDIEKVYLEMPSVDVLMEMLRKRIEAGGGEDFQPFGKQLVKDIIESSSTIREVLIKLQEAL